MFFHLNSFYLNCWGHQSFFVGPLIPLFWTSSDVCPGFQSQDGSPHYHASLPVPNRILRIISGLMPADCMAAKPFPSTIIENMHWWGSRLGPIMHVTASKCETRHMLYQLSYAGSIIRYVLNFLAKTDLQSCQVPGLMNNQVEWNRGKCLCLKPQITVSLINTYSSFDMHKMLTGYLSSWPLCTRCDCNCNLEIAINGLYGI